MNKEFSQNKESKSIFWPINKVAKFIGDIILLPFKPLEK